MNVFDKIQQSIAQIAFEKLFKKHTKIEFKKERGGQQIVAQIRIFGWLVGEQAILSRKPAPAGPQVRTVGH